MQKRIGIACVTQGSRQLSVEFSDRITRRVDVSPPVIKDGDIVEVLYGTCETTSDRRYLEILRVIPVNQSAFTCKMCGTGYTWDESRRFGWRYHPQRCPKCMCYECFMTLDGGMERRGDERVPHVCPARD